jgi:hypothetical protein
MPHVESEYLDRLDPDKIIYRYMDFAKFANLLQTGRLHFHQAADFGDRFEGSVPEIIDEARDLEYQRAVEAGEMRPEGHDIHAEINKCLRRFTYLSCWHLKEDESVAMWDKYGGSDRAVAIQTTVGDFSRALTGDEDDYDIYFGEVDYRPYSSDHESAPEIDDIDIEEDLDDRFFITREAHSLVPFVYKRKGFEYEEEMRAIIQDPPIDEDRDYTLVEIDENTLEVDFRIHTEDGPKYLDTTRENPNKGVNVRVWLDILIDTVHVAPDAGDWFKQTVEDTIRQCDELMEENEPDDLLEESILDHSREPSF